MQRPTKALLANWGIAIAVVCIGGGLFGSVLIAAGWAALCGASPAAVAGAMARRSGWPWPAARRKAAAAAPYGMVSGAACWAAWWLYPGRFGPLVLASLFTGAMAGVFKTIEAKGSAGRPSAGGGTL